MSKSSDRTDPEGPLEIPGGNRLDEQVLEILLRHDPLDVNYGGGRQEYAPIARSILLVLKGCGSEEDTFLRVESELAKCLRPCDNAAEYRAIASEIWELLKSHQG